MWQNPQNKAMGLYFPKGVLVGLIYWGGGHNRDYKEMENSIFVNISLIYLYN